MSVWMDDISLNSVGRKDPLRFLAGCRKEETKPGSVCPICLSLDFL